MTVTLNLLQKPFWNFSMLNYCVLELFSAIKLKNLRGSIWEIDFGLKIELCDLLTFECPWLHYYFILGDEIKSNFVKKKILFK